MTFINFTPISTQELATYITRYCKKHDIFLNHTKLSKLLYYCYGVVLAKYNVQLTTEQPKCYYYYGPLFKDFFEEYSKQTAMYYGWDIHPEPEKENFSIVKEWVDKTIAHFGQFATRYLTNFSMVQGSPWHVSSNNGHELFDVIPNQLIADYFRNEIVK